MSSIQRAITYSHPDTGISTPQARDAGSGRWSLRPHGIRVSFNLATGWEARPLQVPLRRCRSSRLLGSRCLHPHRLLQVPRTLAAASAAKGAPSLLERSLLAALAAAPPAASVRYGEPPLLLLLLDTS